MIHPVSKLASYQKQCGFPRTGFAFLSTHPAKNLNTEERSKRRAGKKSASDFLRYLPSSVLKLFFI
jgi:hypothetical protein